MNLLQFVFESIRGCGVEQAFVLSGDFIQSLLDEASRYFDLIHCCNEVGASFAALAQARLKGFGLCITTYGAGIGAILGLATAFSEIDKLILLSVSPPNQEILTHHKISASPEDQLQIYRTVTKNQFVVRPDNLSSFLEFLNSVSQGPIYIEIPMEFLTEEVKLPNKTQSKRFESPQIELDPRIKQSKKPVILLGKLPLEQQSLARELKVPKCTTPLGIGLLDSEDPWNYGNYVGEITPETHKLVQEADFVLKIGHEQLECEAGRGAACHAADFFLRDLTSELVEKLNSLEIKKPEKKKHEPCSEFDQFFRVLAEVPYFVCCDVSNAGVGLFNYRNYRLIQSPHFLSMGSSIGFAIGVQAMGERALVLIGDGSFQWALSDFLTLAKYQFDSIIVLLNSNSFSLLEQRTVPIDYRKLIESVNGQYFNVQSPEELKEVLEQCESLRDSLILIEIPTEGKLCSEMEIIKNAKKRNPLL